MMGTRVRGPGSGKKSDCAEPPAESPVTGHRSQVTGVLYIVATPIGNLEDITFRAVRTLREADLIAAEDTRHSRKLLTHFGISRPLTSYFDHNKNIKGEYILSLLREGKNVALISDAGTPCISDPGYQLVRDAVDKGIPVVPVPGPCAAIAALSAAGVTTDSFTFEGFLPSGRTKRRDKLATLSRERRVLVLYESAKRLPDTLNDCLDLLGNREVVVAREITKLYEEFRRGTITVLLESLQDQGLKGEVVLLIRPPADEHGDAMDVSASLQRYLSQMSLKDAVKRVALETNTPRTEVYEQALRLQGK